MKKFALGLITALIIIGTDAYSQTPQKQAIPSSEISAKEQKDASDIVLKLGRGFEIAVFGSATPDTSFIVLKGVYIVGYTLVSDTIYVPTRKANCTSAVLSLKRHIAGALCFSGILADLSVGDMEKLSLFLSKLTLSDWIQHKKCSYNFSSFGVYRMINSNEEKQFAQFFLK